MKKILHSRPVCFLLALMLLMQNLAIPVHAGSDGPPSYCQHCQQPRTLDEITRIAPTEATCTTDGMTEGWKCNTCQKYIVEPYVDCPAYNHKEVQKKFASDPTCTESGWTYGEVCALCGKILIQQEEIPPLKHVKHVTTEAKSATCTEDGCTESWECTREGCGYKVESTTLAAKGHTKETITGTPATCTESGLTDGEKCSVCNTILKAQEVIPTKDHTKETVTGTPATCTEDGLTDGEKCSVCGEVLTAQEEIKAKGHTKETVTGKDATCTEDGLTDGEKCSVCGKILKAQEVIPAAHQDVVDMEAKDPTCTEPGQEGGKYCTVCGEIVEQPTQLPASGHEKKVTTEAKDATCTEDGCTEGWECEVCGEKAESEVIKATGHTEVTLPSKKATCTATGLTEGKKCSVCGEILTAQKEIAKTGHTEVSIPGRAATCKQTGLTEGKKCSVCGKELTPQYATPKSTVHKFVPAKDTDPNAGPLDNICSVCGEKQVGLSQGDGAAFVPYEQVDPSSGSNGFTMTTGNDYATEGSAQAMAEEIKSGKLQVFKGKDEDGESLLCLVSPESTMTYLSFEAGTSGVGKVSIVSQDNPGGGATTAEPGNGVGQFGFGIGSDENGKSYLYLVEDGKEVTFTITKEEDEDGRNRVILTTENGSKITIESDSLLYTVQSWDESSELSGSQLEVEKTTSTFTNTNESGESSEAIVIEIVFGVKDLGGSEETKPENGIQAIEPQETSPAVVEQVDNSETNEITTVQEAEQATNFVDMIQVNTDDVVYSEYSEEDWTPEKCKNNKHYFVNSVCKKCGYTCRHISKGKAYDSVILYSEYHQCTVCGVKARHVFHDPNGDPICNCGVKCPHPYGKYVDDEHCDCGRCQTFPAHKWDHGTCQRCGGKCTHSKVDKKCKCKECGEIVHNYKMSPAYDTDSVCTRCKARCSHSSFVIDGDYCKCTTCGRIQTHYWKHSKTPIPNCVCKYCGKTKEHDYDPVTGTCKRCMNECDHTCVPNNYSRCQCTKCGHLLNHKWTEGESSCVCALCGYKLNHLFSMTWGGTTHYVAEYGKTSCTRCGAECKHSFSNCRCTICGLQAKHKWRNGTCTVCGTVCEHSVCNYGNTADCVCAECGTVRKHDWKKKGIFYECTQCGFLTLRKPK